MSDEQVSPRTALDAVHDGDERELKVRRSVDEIMHILHGFIPEFCFRDAHRFLYDAIQKSDLELVTVGEMDDVRLWRKLKLQEGMFNLKTLHTGDLK